MIPISPEEQDDPSEVELDAQQRRAAQAAEVLSSPRRPSKQLPARPAVQPTDNPQKLPASDPVTRETQGKPHVSVGETKESLLLRPAIAETEPSRKKQISSPELTLPGEPLDKVVSTNLPESFVRWFRAESIRRKTPGMGGVETLTREFSDELLALPVSPVEVIDALKSEVQNYNLGHYDEGRLLEIAFTFRTTASASARVAEIAERSLEILNSSVPKKYVFSLALSRLRVRLSGEKKDY